MIISWLLSISLAAELNDYPVETVKLKSKYDNWTIDVKIYNKNIKSPPKGIVVLLPGTDGIAEPDMLEVFSSAPFGGQPSAIGRQVISDGFVYVTFNTRGIRPIESCLLKEGKQPLFTDFRDRCIDFRIRRKINFQKIESDIQIVMNFLHQNKEWNRAKKAIIAVSEGGVHASRLIRSRKINPDLLIGVGVSTSSPRDHFRDQISQNVSYSILRKWMKQKNVEKMTVDDLDLALPIVSQSNREKLKFLINLVPEGLTLNRLSIQSSHMYQEFDKRVPTFIRKNKAEITGLNFFDYEIKDFVSGAQNRDFLADRINLRDSLRGFQGQMVFMYGEFDSLVLHSKESACGKNESKKNCGYHIVPKAAHGLADSNNEYSGEALNIISRALENMANKDQN